MNYLIVVSHPDDEVLGVGATMYKLAQEGNILYVCILSSKVTARQNRPSNDVLAKNTMNAMSILGVHKVIYGDFPNIEFNVVPHLKLVQFIENAIVESNADVVFTHHPADVNIDHVHTSIACQTAIRLFQRRKGVNPIKELLFIEIPSATDWNINSSIAPFRPNTFVEVGFISIEKKIEALSQYEGVLRDFPHPRSVEIITSLAAYRGGQAGMKYAEAFEMVFKREL